MQHCKAIILQLKKLYTHAFLISYLEIRIVINNKLFLDVHFFLNFKFNYKKNKWAFSFHQNKKICKSFKISRIYQR